MELRIAYLRPAQIRERLAATNLAYLPVGPLEWHGGHLPYGVDPFNAEQVALASCGRTGGIVWPTLFWGTERERSPEMLRNLGLAADQYVVGMDFPGLSLPSAYCSEEAFGLVIRETLLQLRRLGVRRAAIINGHGAVNHNQALHRLKTEFSHTQDLQVYVRLAFPRSDIAAGSIGHASADETSLLMHYLPQTVDLAQLPPRDQPLRYQDHAIVDGPGFDGQGPADKTLKPDDDPRLSASAVRGEAMFGRVVEEIAGELTDWLAHA